MVETSAGSGGGAGTLHIPSKGYALPANFYDGCYIYVVGITAPLESRVTAAGYSTSSGIAIFDVEPDFGATPNSTKTVIFLGPLTRAGVLDAVNRIVQSVYAPAWLPEPNLCPDGNQETSGVGNWTDLATPTLVEKVTTAAHVYAGKQAGHVTTNAVDEGIKSDVINVHEGETLNVWGAVKVVAGECAFQLYNETGTAVLKEVIVDQSGYVDVFFTYQVPVGCKQVRVRLASDTTANSEWYNGGVQVLSQQRLLYTLPAQFDNTYHIKDVFYWPNRYQSEVSDSFIPFSDNPETWPHQRTAPANRDFGGANSHRIQLAKPPEYPLFTQFLREDPALTTDASTTTVPDNIVVEGALNLLFLQFVGKMKHNPEAAAQYDRDAQRSLQVYGILLKAAGLMKTEPEVEVVEIHRVRV